MSNPWNLTAGQLRALDAVIEHGTDAKAAASMGKKESTITCHLRLARAHMKAATRLQMIVMYDRWKRQ